MPYARKILGIYKIVNLVNNKVYIGQSKNVLNRIAQHKSDLRSGRHRNPHLQSSFLKYKENNFHFEILEECSEDLLDKKEVYYINQHKSNNREFGYNIDHGGNLYKTTSVETRNKLRRINKDLKLQVGEKNNFAKYNNKTIGMVKKLLFMGMDYGEISDITKVSMKTILKVRRLENWASVLPELNAQISSVKLNSHGTNHKPIVMLDKKMNILRRFSSQKEASEELGFSHSTINSSCSGKTVLGHGYVWLYDDDEIESNIHKKKIEIKKMKIFLVHKINDDGEILETFDSVKEASMKYGLDASSISKVCNGKNKHVCGHIFKKEYLFQDV